MRSFFPLFFCAAILFSGCAQKNGSAKKNKTKPLNLVVLLDMSDRLTVPGQITRDTALLHHIYRSFEQRVRQQLYVNSKDQLQILVAPQHNLPPGIEQVESSLRIHMPEVPVKERAAYLAKNEAAFLQRIDSLYAMVAHNRTASAFAGSDIWKFFDQYLRNYLVQDTNTINRIIVITDGYFDFESLKDKKQDGCRYSYSETLMQQARAAKNDYRRLFDSCGLLPVHINRQNVSVMVAEIDPKSSFAHETELLETLWQSWINTMHTGSSVIIRKGELQEVKGKMMQFIRG